MSEKKNGRKLTKVCATRVQKNNHVIATIKAQAKELKQAYKDNLEFRERFNSIETLTKNTLR